MHPLELLSALWSLPGLFVLGLCVGSFVNVVVRRLPIMLERRWWLEVAQQIREPGLPAPPVEFDPAWSEVGAALEQRLSALPPLSLGQPGSHCPPCGHRLRWTELVPVLSWLWLRGRCSACGTRISPRLPWVELGCGLMFLGMGWHWGHTPMALLWGAWAAALLALSLIDWDTLLLPDSLTQGLIWSGLAAAWWGWTIPVGDAVAGAVVGYASLWTVATLFERVTGKDGMGAGDFKLLAALGAWLGPWALVSVVLLGSVAGVVVGLGMKARGALREGRYVPFGPFLAAGAVATMWLGSSVGGPGLLNGIITGP